MEGFIEVNEIRDFRGGVERREYRWSGGPIAFIHHEFLIRNNNDIKKTDDDVLVIGPFRAKIIDKELMMQWIKVVRQDYPLWWLIYLWHKYSVLFDMVYRRFIITLAVWRLADYNSMIVPTWKDIYAIRKLRAWGRRIHGKA
jgi:hypothetical protein